MGPKFLVSADRALGGRESRTRSFTLSQVSAFLSSGRSRTATVTAGKRHKNESRAFFLDQVGHLLVHSFGQLAP